MAWWANSCCFSLFPKLMIIMVSSRAIKTIFMLTIFWWDEGMVIQTHSTNINRIEDGKKVGLLPSWLCPSDPLLSVASNKNGFIIYPMHIQVFEGVHVCVCPFKTQSYNAMVPSLLFFSLIYHSVLHQPIKICLVLFNGCLTCHFWLYQNLFSWSSGGRPVKWFVSGLLLLLILLQRPTSLSLLGHTCGCSWCGCFWGVVGQPRNCSRRWGVGLMEINATGLEDRTVWWWSIPSSVLYVPVALLPARVSPWPSAQKSEMPEWHLSALLEHGPGGRCDPWWEK